MMRFPDRFGFQREIKPAYHQKNPFPLIFTLRIWAPKINIQYPNTQRFLRNQILKVKILFI